MYGDRIRTDGHPLDTAIAFKNQSRHAERTLARGIEEHWSRREASQKKLHGPRAPATATIIQTPKQIKREMKMRKKWELQEDKLEAAAIAGADKEDDEDDEEDWDRDRDQEDEEDEDDLFGDKDADFDSEYEMDEEQRINDEKRDPPIQARDARAITQIIKGSDLTRFPRVRKHIDRTIRSAASIGFEETTVKFPLFLDNCVVRMSDELLYKLFLEYRDRKFRLQYYKLTGALWISWRKTISQLSVLEKLEQPYKKKKEREKKEEKTKQMYEQQQSYDNRRPQFRGGIELYPPTRRDQTNRRVYSSSPSNPSQNPSEISQTTGSASWGLKPLTLY